MLAYDKDALLEILRKGLSDHVERGYEVVHESVDRERVAVYVIEYDDDLTWVKVTGDLTGKQRAILSSTAESGRLFAENIRQAVKGKSLQDAQRAVQNFAQVDRVEITLWPPWQNTLPPLTNHIVIRTEGE
jgi:hypothetical protein